MNLFESLRISSSLRICPNLLISLDNTINNRNSRNKDCAGDSARTSSSLRGRRERTDHHHHHHLFKSLRISWSLFAGGGSALTCPQSATRCSTQLTSSAIGIPILPGRGVRAPVFAKGSENTRERQRLCDGRQWKHKRQRRSPLTCCSSRPLCTTCSATPSGTSAAAAQGKDTALANIGSENAHA